VEKSDKAAEHGSAAELLADWRSATRDTKAAQTAESVAALALVAAGAAEEAAAETDEAAQAAEEAAIHAKGAATQARMASGRATEASQLAIANAEGDKARAGQAVTETEQAEIEARDRFHVAQEKGFPKESD